MCRRFTTIFVAILLCVASDQAVKNLAKNNLSFRQSQSFLGDTFRLSLIENHGAFLGLGSSLSEEARMIVFVAIIAIGLAVATVWLLFSPKMSKLTLFATVLTVAGGLGNLVDRVFNHGGVIDFMNIGIGSIRTGIFNVADIYITLGTLLFIVASSKRQKNA